MEYAVEELSANDDDGTMVENVDTLRAAVVGRRIVSAEEKEFPPKHSWQSPYKQFVITLDDGTQVGLGDTDDCCAYTELQSFLLHPELVEHVITGVGTTDKYETWHIFADMGDVLELTVGWSSGNPFYYGFGFDINVVPVAS